MNTFLDSLRQPLKNGSTLIKLLYLNVGLFVLLKLSSVILLLLGVNTNSWFTYLEMPSSFQTLWHQPWSLVTYMFLHIDFFHIFFNMLCLYWFGKLFLNFFSQKQLVGLYFLGGFGGALFYFAAYNVFPYFSDKVDQSYLLGASASIMAIILAVATASPNYSIRLFLIGNIRMKYFAGITVLISMLSMAGNNAGGEFAHLGGALVGFLYAYFLNRGTDLSKPINQFIDWLVTIFRSKPRFQVKRAKKPRPIKSDAEYNQSKVKKDAELDKILDKIKLSGYETLSAKEKQRLFDQSQSL